MKPAEAAPCPNQFEPAVGRSQANPFELPLALKLGSELQPVLEVGAVGGRALARPGDGSADGGCDTGVGWRCEPDLCPAWSVPEAPS